MVASEVLMTAKKKISAREFHERMKARRKSPLRPEFVEKFNKITEEDEKHEREEKKKGEKKIARSPEADL